MNKLFLFYTFFFSFDFVWRENSMHFRNYIYSNDSGRTLTPSEFKFTFPCFFKTNRFPKAIFRLFLISLWDLNCNMNAPHTTTWKKTWLRLETRLKPSTFHLPTDELFQKWWTTEKRQIPMPMVGCWYSHRHTHTVYTWIDVHIVHVRVRESNIHTYAYTLWVYIRFFSVQRWHRRWLDAALGMVMQTRFQMSLRSSLK